MFEEDKYFEFRDIITMNYRYSYGGQSHFFRELKRNKTIMGAKCPKCGVLRCPPRSGCSTCYEDTVPVEMGERGEVVVCVQAWFASSTYVGNIPYFIGYVLLDGADSAIHQNIVVRDEAPSVDAVKKGTRVKAVFKAEREGKVTDFFFVPESDLNDELLKTPKLEESAVRKYWETLG